MSKRKEKKRVARATSAKNAAFWEKIKTVRIGSDYFSVLFKKKVRNGECMGEMCHDERELVLDEELKGMDTLLPISTLFHEICHGIERTYIQSNEEDKEYEEKSEFLVDMIAESLTMVMMDNIEMFRLILDRIEERKNSHETVKDQTEQRKNR